MEGAIRKAFKSSFKAYEFNDEEQVAVEQKIDELFLVYRSITSSRINKKWKGYLKSQRDEF